VAIAVSCSNHCRTGFGQIRVSIPYVPAVVGAMVPWLALSETGPVKPVMVFPTESTAKTAIWNGAPTVARCLKRELLSGSRRPLLGWRRQFCHIMNCSVVKFWVCMTVFCHV
jgi:hypothetical protein